jgi:hypothetical protein
MLQDVRLKARCIPGERICACLGVEPFHRVLGVKAAQERRVEALMELQVLVANVGGEYRGEILRVRD